MLKHTLSRQASVGIDGEVLENLLVRFGPRGIHEPDKDDTPQADEKWIGPGGGGSLLSGNKSQGLYVPARAVTDVAVRPRYFTVR